MKIATPPYTPFPDSLRRALRWGGVALCAVGLPMLCFAPPLQDQERTRVPIRRPAGRPVRPPARQTITPLVRPNPEPGQLSAPASLSFSRRSARAITAKIIPAARPGVITAVSFRNLRTQTDASSILDPASTRSPKTSFELPSPWNGEIKIRDTVKGERHSEFRFVAMVVEPITPGASGLPPRILYGPAGRSSVQFTDRDLPPSGTQILLTTPPLTVPAAPRGGWRGDPIEIGFLPPLKKPASGMVGLTPDSPTAQARVVLNVFDPATQQWTALPSWVDRYGTVYAQGPLPGVYAVTAAP